MVYYKNNKPFTKNIKKENLKSFPFLLLINLLKSVFVLQYKYHDPILGMSEGIQINFIKGV